MRYASHDEYMRGVNAKVNAAKEDLMKAGNKDLRGFSETAERLTKSAENLYFSMGDDCFDPVNSVFTYFSNKPGLNDVTNVAAVDIIDLSIQATRQSVMGYLSAERAMDKPIDVAWFQTLVAMNDVSGYVKDEKVFSPFSPIDKKINLGPVSQVTEIAVADLTPTTDPDDGSQVYKIEVSGVDADKPLVAKSITLELGTGTADAFVAESTAQDLKGMNDEDKKEGTLYWEGTSPCTSAIIKYESGVITLKADAALTAETIRISSKIERTAQKSGANTLKVKPKVATIQLVAKPNRIILENSFEDNAYMNKQAFNMSQKGIQLDFGKRAINQLLQVFVAYLDFTSVSATFQAAAHTIEAVNGGKIMELDLTDYLLSSSQAATKYDFINQAMLKLQKDLLTRTGKGPTCFLVDSEAAMVLGNCQAHFTANPTLTENLDGVIGTYQNKPVIRHHVLDGVIDEWLAQQPGYVDPDKKTHGLVIALFKSEDGQVAPTMYGEYLPPLTYFPLGREKYIAA
jgi:hypothetical protein